VEPEDYLERDTVQREIAAVADESGGRIKLQMIEAQLGIVGKRVGELEGWRERVEDAEKQATRDRLADLQARERKRVDDVEAAARATVEAARVKAAADLAEQDRRRHELRRSIIVALLTFVLGVIGTWITSWLLRR